MPTMLTTKLLEKRLLSRETVRSGPSIAKCASNLFAVFKSIFEKNADDPSVLNSFLRSMILFELDTSKDERSQVIAEEEISELQTLEKSIEEQIRLTQENIVLLTKELGDEQRIRKHKEDCDRAAVEVNKLPSTSVLYKEIEDITISRKHILHEIQIEDIQMECLQKKLLYGTCFFQDIVNTFKIGEETQRLKSLLASSHLDGDNEETEREVHSTDRNRNNSNRERNREDSHIAKKRKIENQAVETMKEEEEGEHVISES